MNKSSTLFQETTIINVAAINNINQKGGKRIVQEVSDKELITITIDRYAELQRIKQSNGNHENKELDYSIRLGTVQK